ncbi:hypothetical protein ACLOJK_021375 [Asimina triloba]
MPLLTTATGQIWVAVSCKDAAVVLLLPMTMDAIHCCPIWPSIAAQILHMAHPDRSLTGGGFHGSHVGKDGAPNLVLRQYILIDAGVPAMVLLHLSFDEDLGRSASKEEENVKHKNKKRKKNEKEQKQPPDNDKKKSKQELREKTREEVKADFKAASFVRDPEERRRMQSETLSAVFQTYFRILKHTTEAVVTRPKVGTVSESGASVQHPLLTPCLNGLGKFSHLINLDFMGDLMTSLKNLASSDGSCDAGSPGSRLTVSERLQCCIVAFKVMRNNLDALNVDLQDFFVQLYNLLLEYKPDREGQGEILAEALKIMLCEGRQHDMQRAAAFIKRLATFSLCFSSAEAIAGDFAECFAGLVTVRHLLQKNIKCRNLLENDAGGGSLSGSVAKYQTDASDPNLSGALASVLWELSLLSKHYHPAVSSMASSISSMSTGHNQVFLSNASPPQAFSNLSIERESFNLSGNSAALKLKRKRGSGSLVSSHDPVKDSGKSIDEEEVRKRFSDHFVVLRDISENERLRGELDLTLASLKMYKEYKKQKTRKKEVPKMRKKKGLKT